MKRFVSFITRISEFFAAHAAARVVFYAAIALALVLTYLMTDATEVSFIYNEF